MKKLDHNGLILLERLEGLKTKAYKDTKNVFTIGIGSTYYENGTRVKEGDTLTKEECYNLFNITKDKYEKPINEVIKVVLNQNQFNALFCFCYNVGAFGFKTSELVKVINANGSRLEIEKAFMNWKGKTKNSKGEFVLQSRRQAEINEYFKK
jgi:lysozyme